jgi:glycosyltransferase involved in cell wall biosynthesis
MRQEIDVVIPTYNRARTLGRAIDSVLGQSLPVHEVIVVDDGSTDETATLIAKYVAQDPRVVYMRGSHAGAPAARNCGIARATAEFIAFQDSDDEWDPHLLETLLPLIEGPDQVAFCSIRLNRDEATSSILPAGFVANPARMLRRQNIVSTQAAVLPRSLLDETKFDTRLPRLQDWDLWLSLTARNVRFQHVPVPLVQVNVQADSITRNSEAYYLALRMILWKHRRQFVRSPYEYLRNIARVVVGPILRKTV